MSVLRLVKKKAAYHAIISLFSEILCEQENY